MSIEKPNIAHAKKLKNACLPTMPGQTVATARSNPAATQLRRPWSQRDVGETSLVRHFHGDDCGRHESCRLALRKAHLLAMACDSRSHNNRRVAQREQPREPRRTCFGYTNKRILNVVHDLHNWLFKILVGERIHQTCRSCEDSGATE